MSYEISDTIQQMISQKMASGIYESEEQLLMIALNKMDDYEQAVADIKQGLADEDTGRMRSLQEVDRDMSSFTRFGT